MALFLSVGLFGLAVDAAVFSCLFDTGLSRGLCRAPAILSATVVTYALNRRWTFRAGGRRAWSEFVRYGLVTLAAQGFSYGLFMELAVAAPTLPLLVDLVTGSVAATALSFTGQRLFTFRRA